MGLSLPTTNGVARFIAYCNLPQFQCPQYAGALWTPYNAPSGLASMVAGIQPAFSYCEALSFMVVPWATGHTDSSEWPGNLGTPTPYTSSSPYFMLPTGYFPKITKIGKSAAKIFVADGEQWAFGTNGALPQYTLSSYPADTTGTSGTMFADWGAFDGDSHAWDRTAEPGNIAVSAFKPNYDARPLAFRHGSQQQFGPASTCYKRGIF